MAAGAPKSFAAAVEAWARKTEELQTDILHAALRLLVDEVTRSKDEGGHLPIDEGNLRNSVAVSTLAPITYDWTVSKFRDPSDAVNNAVAGVAVGQTAWIGFRAPYAHLREADHGFVRLAAQRWPAIVEEAARAVVSRRGRQ